MKNSMKWGKLKKKRKSNETPICKLIALNMQMSVHLSFTFSYRLAADRNQVNKCQQTTADTFENADK